MRFADYLYAKTVTLCFLGIGGVLTGAVAAMAGAASSAILLAAVLYLAVILAWLAVNFLMERKRIRRLEQLAEELPEKYLLGELLPVPADPVERRYYQVMREISRSAVGAVERARREQEEYRDYVEGWIHEIKTPLTACSLILANGGDVRKLKTELKRADNLTESILYYARLRTAEKDTQIGKISAAAAIEEAVKSQMELLMAAGIRVETEGDFSVYTDSKTLVFILKQLLINCGKYCPGCLVRMQATQGVITVEDNGIGIPSQELSRVTDRGFTGTNGRRVGGSTGMGLYLAGELCRRLGLKLLVESVQGEYTKITLSFGNLTNL